MKIVAAIILGIAVFVLISGGGQNAIYAKVASDAVEQYEIVRRNGTPIDRCVHAGIVSAAYVQAKDEPNYKRWKAVENADCAKASIPR